jgi:hypothetical protein
MPCTYRPESLGHYVLTLFADEPGLTLEPADRTWRGLLRGEWTPARCGGCANSDGWVTNPHVRVQFERGRASGASGTVRVLLVPERALASRGTGFYTTPRVPSSCTIADIWRLADVKFVVGDHVAMTFYNIPFDRDMYIVPCTFEPGVCGKFALFVRADAPFELVEENAELPPVPDPLLE